MAITRALMNRQMYNMGGPALEAGAPDLRLTGDQRNRGSYTQRRRAQMAGGGITQIGKPGGLVEPGIYKYGAWDWVKEKAGKLKDKFVDDIIPNEIKENKGIAALTGAALLNQFGLPDLIPGAGTSKGMGQNWLGNLLGGVMPGDTKFNTVLGDTVPFTTAGGRGRNMLGDLDPNNVTGWMQKGLTMSPAEFLTGETGGGIWDVLKKGAQTIMPGGETGYFDLYGNAGKVAKKVGETIIPGGEPGYVDLYNNPLETLKTIGETIIPG